MPKITGVMNMNMNPDFWGMERDGSRQIIP